jgi:hypothetical protein
MWILLDAAPGLLGDEGLATYVKLLVEAASEQNKILIRRFGLPPLYDSGVRFQNEPWAGKFETIASALKVYQRRWGDCAHLAAYRIGELRLEGIPASCKVYWRHLPKPGGRLLKLFHVEVRLPDGSVEDPSRLLGM